MKNLLNKVLPLSLSAILIVAGTFTFLLVPTAYAAIAFGASTRGASFSTTNTITWTGPTVSGSNKIGIVSTDVNNLTSIATVTWGGSSMTEVTGAGLADGSWKVQTFYILNPSSAGSVVMTTASGNWSSAFATASYFTGVDQTNPIDNQGTGTAGASGNFNGSATTNTNNTYIVDTLIQESIASTLSATSPSTKMQGGNTGSGTFTFASSYKSIASAGSATMAWTSGDTTHTYLWGWVSLKANAVSSNSPHAKVIINNAQAIINKSQLIIN